MPGQEALEIFFFARKTKKIGQNIIRELQNSPYSPHARAASCPPSPSHPPFNPFPKQKKIPPRPLPSRRSSNAIGDAGAAALAPALAGLSRLERLGL